MAERARECESEVEKQALGSPTRLNDAWTQGGGDARAWMPHTARGLGRSTTNARHFKNYQVNTIVKIQLKLPTFPSSIS